MAKISDTSIPLAARLIPEDLDYFYGQENLLSKGKFLRNIIEKGQIKSALFYGPSGTGKTALANIIAKKVNADVYNLNAVTAGVADLKKILEYSKNSFNSKKVLLILDEIHHFNRTQQDVLLPSVEKGEIILIGITTENPFFYINRALLSRFLIFEFKEHSEDSLRKILERAIKEGFKDIKISIDEKAKDAIVKLCNKDARRLLNIFEMAVLAFEKDGKVEINLDIIKEIVASKNINYDRASDNHYDHASAFIKSMRGSDPDATVYWLAKMLEAGEDPLFIARRIVICASEDVGNANPLALVVANSAFDAVRNIGMPEAKIILSQAAIYVAVSPKSNSSYLAINKAIEEVKNGPERKVPLHLKDSTADGNFFGDGKGYKYPHDFPGHYVEQQYMPDPKIFYIPSNQGFEQEISKRLERLRKK